MQLHYLSQLPSATAWLSLIAEKLDDLAAANQVYLVQATDFSGSLDWQWLLQEQQKIYFTLQNQQLLLMDHAASAVPLKEQLTKHYQLLVQDPQLALPSKLLRLAQLLGEHASLAITLLPPIAVNSFVGSLKSELSYQLAKLGTYHSAVTILQQDDYQLLPADQLLSFTVAGYRSGLVGKITRTKQLTSSSTYQQQLYQLLLESYHYSLTLVKPGMSQADFIKLSQQHFSSLLSKIDPDLDSVIKLQIKLELNSLLHCLVVLDNPTFVIDDLVYLEFTIAVDQVTLGVGDSLIIIEPIFNQGYKQLTVAADYQLQQTPRVSLVTT